MGTLRRASLVILGIVVLVATIVSIASTEDQNAFDDNKNEENELDMRKRSVEKAGGSTEDGTKNDASPVQEKDRSEDENEEKDKKDRSLRVDCFPESRSVDIRLTEQECKARGCFYHKKAAADSSLGVVCYYSPKKSVRYSILSQKTTDWGFRLHLGVSGPSPFAMDFLRPVLDVHMLTDEMIRFTFDDRYASPPRYRVPLQLGLPRGPKASNTLYDFNVTDNSTLSFRITRKSTGTVVLDTGVGGLVLSEQFLQLATTLPSDHVYGLGEHSRHSFRRQFDPANAWPAFARDQPPGDDTNLYGVHPFYTCVEDSQGNTHGVFLLNSNAQEYAFSPGPMLTWRTIGGVLDFFVFMGPTPENVVQQYTQLIGRPMMPPYWSLGFQLSRYGYNNLANLQRAVDDTLRYNIPLDVQFVDIDHTDEGKIFTIDQENFGGLNDYFNTLRDGGMRTIIVLDPFIISNESDYQPYEMMQKTKGNIRWPEYFEAPNGSADSVGSMLGFGWPKGKVVFPDFFKKNTRRIWKKLIKNHCKKLVFDGLWLDMNEPANFGTNEARPWNWPEDDLPYWSLYCGNNRWDDPVYRPMAAYQYDEKDNRKPLADKTLCMNGVQGQDGKYRHYDVHNLYGWSQASITLDAARVATGERSLVISRSTFPGSGKYAGHWLGDNTSIWPHLRDSIIGMLDFNLFGIPYIGADICGCFQNTTEELCLRWMQLGAFYPLSRNHNGIGFKDQHPGVFGDPLATASREILEIRYWLLPYLYTLFHQAHTQGSTVVRPLHHEFPTDQTALETDRQFLWGPALLISPILEQNQTELKYYLPEGRWYDFYTGNITEGPIEETVAVTLTSKPGLHLRGGHIIVVQAPANNTHFSRQNSLQIRAMLNQDDEKGGEASGFLFWDDGTSVDTFEKETYFLASYNISKRVLEVTLVHGNVTKVPDMTRLRYDKIIVHGVTRVKTVAVTGADGNPINSDFSFDTELDMLNVTLIDDVTMGTEFTMSWD